MLFFSSYTTYTTNNMINPLKSTKNQNPKSDLGKVLQHCGEANNLKISPNDYYYDYYYDVQMTNQIIKVLFSYY